MDDSQSETRRLAVRTSFGDNDDTMYVTILSLAPKLLRAMRDLAQELASIRQTRDWPLDVFAVAFSCYAVEVFWYDCFQEAMDEAGSSWEDDWNDSGYCPVPDQALSRLREKYSQDAMLQPALTLPQTTLYLPKGSDSAYFVWSSYDCHTGKRYETQTIDLDDIETMRPAPRQA